MKDVVLSKESENKIKIVPVSDIKDVLKVALDWKGKESILEKISKSQ